jgi:hypothetical protein
MRRHVYVTVITLIGKEANRWEEQFYLGVEAEAQAEYGIAPKHRENLTAQLTALAAVMGHKRLAHAIGMSRRHLSNLLRGIGIIPIDVGPIFEGHKRGAFRSLRS